MRLRIAHTTSYAYDAPVPYGLQQVRKTPKPTRGQTVLHWTSTVEGGRKELSFQDQHRNHVDLLSFEPGTTRLVIRSEGEVEMAETSGMVGPHEGHTPLWLFERATPLTRIGPLARELVRSVGGESDLDRLHALSAAISAAVEYQTGESDLSWAAEDVLRERRGVCQDHTHVFLACARVMGFPARYVSGYLMMNDRVAQEATHAWAEAHVANLGWVGFDISNGISPDTRYVRVATGLDYTEAAPVSGMRYGTAQESLDVSVEVAQQQ